jgi:hypothetical protein
MLSDERNWRFGLYFAFLYIQAHVAIIFQLQSPFELDPAARDVVDTRTRTVDEIIARQPPNICMPDLSTESR